MWPLRPGDEEGRDIVRADVVQVAGDAERFGGLLPASLCRVQPPTDEYQRKNTHQSQQDYQPVSLGKGGQPSLSHKPDGYLLGSYRIATAPEPNSSRLTSFKSTRFDSPANNVGPLPAKLGCTTSSYSSINPSSVNASASFTPLPEND